MNGKVYNSRNWLAFLVSVVAVAMVAVLALLIWNSQAATPAPPKGGAFVQLSPTVGQPGAVVTIGGGGWQPGETVLIYLVETENGSTMGSYTAAPWQTPAVGSLPLFGIRRLDRGRARRKP
jgi:hypothetical protein